MVRFILDIHPRSHIGAPELRSVGYLSTNLRASQMMLNHVHTIFYKQCPTYLGTEFNLISDHHHHNTRSSNFNFIITQGGAEAQNLFHYQAISGTHYLKVSNVQNQNSVTNRKFESI